jgi:hypothetical protein
MSKASKKHALESARVVEEKWLQCELCGTYALGSMGGDGSVISFASLSPFLTPLTPTHT